MKKNAPFSRTNVTNASRGYSSSAPVRETLATDQQDEPAIVQEHEPHRAVFLRTIAD